MNSDLTFITNEENQTLLDRFQVLIKDAQFFDVLVGYFFVSGFHALYKSLSETDKVRILIGISTNKEVVRLIEHAKPNSQMEIPEIKKYCQIDSQGERLLKKAVDSGKLTPRGYHRVLKVARTIADLEGSEKILLSHLAEALSYKIEQI